MKIELIHSKNESDKLMAHLMDPARIKKEQEDLIDLLRRHEVR
jgi:hypothetical protein